MIYFSTDEIFGPAPEGKAYKEWDRYNSTNPYSASKAGGEELCLAYANTYKTPVIITHTMNVFGERQHPEKFIPMTIRKVLLGEEVIIHSNVDLTRAGSRFYIHARNVANAMMFILHNSLVRDKYNIVGEKEVDNLELAQIIARVVGKKLKYKMVDFHSSRPGHDLRYALDGTKMGDLGWHIPMEFEKSLEKTIMWTLEHPHWLGLINAENDLAVSKR
jgi:dTDP-glucose 4,6-dehydratase